MNLYDRLYHGFNIDDLNHFGCMKYHLPESFSGGIVDPKHNVINSLRSYLIDNKDEIYEILEASPTEIEAIFPIVLGEGTQNSDLVNLVYKAAMAVIRINTVEKQFLTDTDLTSIQKEGRNRANIRICWRFCHLLEQRFPHVYELIYERDSEMVETLEKLMADPTIEAPEKARLRNGLAHMLTNYHPYSWGGQKKDHERTKTLLESVIEDPMADSKTKNNARDRLSLFLFSGLAESGPNELQNPKRSLELLEAIIKDKKATPDDIKKTKAVLEMITVSEATPELKSQAQNILTDCAS